MKTLLNQWMLDTNALIRYQIIKKTILEKHSVNGIQEFEQIEQWIYEENSPFYSNIPTNKKLFRARKIRIDDINTEESGILICPDNFIGYNEENSRECPLHYSPPGRNNIAGQSYFYASENEETACAEIKTGLGSLISVATFHTTKELTIIDFSKDVAFPKEQSTECGMSLGRFFTLVMLDFSEPVENDEGYFFTQIISDYIRKTGIDCVGYQSYYTGGMNYTIFNSSPHFLKYDSSKVLIHQYCNSSFWDFSSQKELFSYPGDMKYNKDSADSMIRNLSRQNKHN